MMSSTFNFLRTLAAGVLLALCASSCNDARAEGAPPQASPALSTVTLAVEGMSCASCSVAVRVALEKLDGVRDARVSFEQKRAIVRYVVGQVTPQQMVEAVNRLGYRASVGTKTS